TAAHNAEEIYKEYQDLKSQRKRDNLLSFVFGLPGLLCFVANGVMAGMMGEARRMGTGPSDDLLGVGSIFFTIMGCILMGIAYCFAAKYKGRSPLWGLMGFIGCFGLLLLA